jgi:ferritin-like metal-binding protein YciE
MGIFTPDDKNLHDLYIALLERTLSSERQIVEEGLPAMIDKATNRDLTEVFRKHLEESKMHVARLERILDAEEGEANTSRCKTTDALIGSAESDVSNAASQGLRDAVLIAAGNKLEHHEIAVYGTLRTWAAILGEHEDVDILEKTLDEEERADDALTKLSREINAEAAVA